MDPFVGSGTSLVEAARLGYPSVGTDLNPAAVLLTRLYRFINVEPRDRRCYLDEIRENLHKALFADNGGLFFERGPDSDDHIALETLLVSLWREFDTRETSDLAAALVVLSDFYRKDLDRQRVMGTWARLERNVQNLPYSKNPVTVYHSDARVLPVENESIDFVLTSPPYINVHNYHQRFRRSVESLGWDVLSVARSEIGSNRQNRGNRFLTVVQYSMDMALALKEMARATKTGKPIILVLGRESSVQGVRFFNGELVAELAGQCLGLPLEKRQERKFLNRFGTKIYEDIIHFRSPREVPARDFVLEAARGVAMRALLASRSCAEAQVKNGIDKALAHLNTIHPSPIRVLTPSVLRLK